MNTERIDTDAPLNSNNNEEEDIHYFDKQNSESIQDIGEEFTNEQVKSQSNQSSMPLGGKTSIEQMSQKSIKSNDLSLKPLPKLHTFQKRSTTNETVSNKSMKMLRVVNEEPLFQIFNNQKDKSDEQEQYFPQFQNKKITKQNINEFQDEYMKNAEEYNQSQIKQNKTNHHDKIANVQDVDNKNNQNNIGKVENGLLLFESQSFSDNKNHKKANQNKQENFVSESGGNENDILEFDEIQIKNKVLPKPTVKKSVIQTFGIVKYMENSFLGKKKNTVEEGGQQQNKRNGSQDKDSEMLYLSFNSNNVEENDVKNDQKDKVKNYNESKFANAAQDNIFLDKYPSQVSQEKEKYSQFSIKDQKFESFDEKRNCKLAISVANSGDKSKSISSRKNQKTFTVKDEGQKKFIQLKKIKLVKRIIKVFEKYNILRRFSSIPHSYFRFFGDKATWLNTEIKENIFQKIKHKIGIQKQQKQHINLDQEDQISSLVLYEDNKLVIFFKILVIICSLLQCIYIPTTIAFSNSFEPTQQFDILFTIIPTIVFIIDMYINFNLAYFFNGKLVCNRRQIATNYFFGQYWFDFVSIILQILMDKSLPSLAIRVYIIQKELQRKFYYAYKLIRLAMELLLSCHILACTFILAASYSPDNWLTSNKLDKESNQIQYLNSLYYIIVTLATIGYGDIHPVSNTEKLFLCFIGFVGSGLFAYNISTISSIVNDSIKKKLETKRQILSVTEYMTERQISRSVQNQILQQLYYNMRTERKQPKVISECLKHVSENLKDSLFNEYFGKILYSNQYFKRKFSKQFLKSLIPKFKEEVFPPGQIIFQAGEVFEKLIFIRQGGITHYLNYSNPTPIVSEYNEGQWFGFQEFFTGGSKNCYAKSKDFTSIIYIERNDFLEVVQSFPRDKEAYCMIKDKILYSNLYISQNCNVCNSMFHTIQKCPYLHYAKKKEYVILKNNYSLTSKREPYLNRRSVKYNSRTTNEQVRYQLKNYRMTHLLMAEGFNLIEKQMGGNVSDSIIENQLRNHNRSRNTDFMDEHTNQSPINNDQTTSNINSNELFQQQNSQAVHTSNNIAQITSIPMDGSITICKDSPLAKQALPGLLQRNLSKFGEFASKIKVEDEIINMEIQDELNSPLSVRKTRQSFKNDDGEVEYQSVDSKQVQNLQEQENKNQNNIGLPNKNGLLDLEDSKDFQLEEQNKRIYKEEEIYKESKDLKLQMPKDIFKLKTTESKDNHFSPTIYPIKMKYFGFKGGRKTDFILKPQNTNNIIKILPHTIETDQEFFQKYDGIRWENNELKVLKSDIIASQASLTQIEGGILDQIAVTPTIMNFSTINVHPKSVGIANNFSQAQAQLIHHNLSVINEENQKEDKEDITASILPLNSIPVPTNEQQILMKILNEVESIKQTQDSIRKESYINKFPKPEIYQQHTIQRSFTFNAKNQNNVQDEQYEQSARFGQQDDESLGKARGDSEEIRNQYKNFSNKNIKDETSILEQDETNAVKNESIPFSFQLEKSKLDSSQKIQNESKLQPRKQILNYSYSPSNYNQQQSYNNFDPSFKFGKIKSNLYQNNQSQFDENSPQSINYSNPFSQNTQNTVNKSTYFLSQLKLKDKIEYQFFIAFERQNNWKAYFPIYNLSYLTEKVIKNQKRNKKIDTIPPVKIHESTMNQKRGTKFERLSQLVIENKDRFTSNQSPKDQKLSLLQKKQTIARETFFKN